MKRTSKIGAVHSGIGSTNIIGAVVGGGVNAVVDKYVKSLLPKVAGFDLTSVLKIGAGVALPMLVKGNKMIETSSFALMACGVSDIIKETVLGGNSEQSATSGVYGLDEDITYVGSQQRIPFPEFKATLEDNTINGGETLVG